MISVPAEQHLLERLAKDLVENGVEDRVDHGAGVAEPGDQVEDFSVDAALAVGAHGRHQIQHEKWRPEDHKREEHHAEDLRRLLLQSDNPAVPGTVARDHAAVARMVAAHLTARVPEQVRRRRIALVQRHARRAHRPVMRPHRRRPSQRRRSRVSGQQSSGAACKRFERFDSRKWMSPRVKGLPLSQQIGNRCGSPRESSEF